MKTLSTFSSIILDFMNMRCIMTERKILIYAFTFQRCSFTLKPTRITQTPKNKYNSNEANNILSMKEVGSRPDEHESITKT